LANGLREYPLYPYLRYQRIGNRLDRTNDEEIAAFIATYAGGPLAARLHQRWITSLARRKQWDTLLAHYPADARSTEFECLRRRGLYHTGQRTAALEGIEELWLVGSSQPAACDPLFAAW